jgi:hypothetical protein
VADLSTAYRKHLIIVTNLVHANEKGHSVPTSDR